MPVSPEDGEFQAGTQPTADGRHHAFFQIVPRGTDPIGHEHDLQLFDSEEEGKRWLQQEAARRGFSKIVWGARRPEP